MAPPNVLRGLRASALDLAYDKRRIVRGIDLEIPLGGITAFVGPNGSGKSTLLKGLSRLKAADGGIVLLDSRDIARLPSVEVARRLAVLPQMPEMPERMTVRELVEQGRFPHVGAFGRLHRQDNEAVLDALALTGMTVLADRPLEHLSGGERQRAWIALALAQATPWLLLDEPTTFLDIRHQFEILHLIQRLNRERGMTIIMVLHDLAQAARFANRMVVLANGCVHSDGDPAHVLTPAMLAEVFGIEARVLRDPQSPWPIVVPVRPLPDGPVAQTPVLE